MKNYFRLNLIVFLFAVPFILNSCSDDDDMPVARISIQETGGVQSEGNLYIVNGDSICIDKISIVPDESTPTSMITACNYYWDGFFVGPAFGPDFNRKFYVYNQPAGRHYLTIKMLVAAQGYSLATYISQIPVVVLPQGTSLESVNPDGTDLFSDAQTSRSEGDSQMQE